MSGDMQKTPLNMKEALEIFDGDEELLKEICGDFLHDYPDLVANIKEAVLGGDAISLHSHAHKFKGLLRNLAANTAGDIAFELEAMGKKQDLNGAGEAFERLTEACEALKDFVIQYTK